MSLKDLYELSSGNELKEVLHDYLTEPLDYRAKHSFEDYVEDLRLCPNCNSIVKEEFMLPHKWDIGEVEEFVCESCRNDESW